MVELSSLYGLDMYTTRGKYVGRVQDVVLNIKKGRVSTLKVKRMKAERKTVGLKDVISSIRIVPEADETKVLKEEPGAIDIPYERVQAVGDILLISPETSVEIGRTT